MRKRVLVVRFSAFGDLVLTTGPLAQLRQQFPSLAVDLLTSEIGQELYINSIDVDRTILIEKGTGLTGLIKAYRKLPSYDLVIDLQGNFKSHLLRLFLRCPFFRIKKQSKERRAFVKNRSYKADLTQHVVEKYYQTLREAIPELTEKSLEELRPVFPAHPLVYNPEAFDFKNAVVIHPYASQKNKEWPYFKEFCEALGKEKTPVIIVGKSEQGLNLSSSNSILDLTNKTSLHEMLSIMSKAKAVVTTDSGPMHLGVASKTPTLALFGPTTKEFGFYPNFEKVKVIEEDLDCRPCHVHGGDICPLAHHHCMKNISVSRLQSELIKLV